MKRFESPADVILDATGTEGPTPSTTGGQGPAPGPSNASLDDASLGPAAKDAYPEDRPFAAENASSGESLPFGVLDTRAFDEFLTSSPDAADRATPGAGSSRRSVARCFHVTPAHYEPNYAYPLIVWLHGAGGDERQISQVLPHISLRNYVALGVRGSRSYADGWDWDLSHGGVAAAGEAVLEGVDAACRRHHVDTGRIFIAGYLAGGEMAVRLAWMFPDRFAAAVTVNGPIPQGAGVMPAWRGARRTPLFALYGDRSQAVSRERACQQLRFTHAAGLTVHLRQYPTGDDLTTAMLRDVNCLLMEQVTGVASSDGDEPPPRDGN